MRRFVSRRVLIVFTIFALSFLFFLESQAEKLPKPEQWLQILQSATSLDREGIRPWHMRMTFQVYDMEGKASDAGIMEAWWPGKGKPAVRVATPLLQGALPSPEQAAEQGTGREVYLLQRLLTEVVHPVPVDLDIANHEFEERTRTFSKTELHCLRAHWVKGRRIEATKNLSANDWPGDDPEFCTDLSDVSMLRIRLDLGHLSVARNKLGMFEGAHIAYANDLAYSGRLTISGQIDTLELSNQIAIPADAKPILGAKDIPGVLESPTRISGRGFEDVAERAGGCVVLSLVIGKDGRVSHLDPLASTDPRLTAPVIDVVKTWLYKPAKRDGQPVAVPDLLVVINLRAR